MRYIRWILLPFSWLYGMVIEIRNFLYDKNILKSFRFDLPVISVGNITVGGTGKTPFTEYLIRLLKDKCKPAVLSRGYKRKTRGFLVATDTDNAITIGDESFQYFVKYGAEITVAVAEDRAFAIPNLLDARSEVNMILLDDAFQHRSVKPSLNILLTDYNTLFTRDYLLPAGDLREQRKAAGRSDLIVVTKCPPAITPEEREKITREIRRYTARDCQVFFTFTEYGAPEPVHDKDLEITGELILVTGIANAKPLARYLDEQFHVIKHFEFADHHYFTSKELDGILRFADRIKGNPSIIFTEKDILRILKTPLEEILMPYPVFFQPISYKFVVLGNDFDRIMLHHVKNFDMN